MINQRAPDAAPPRTGRGVHRLQLGMIRPELLDRPDAEQLTVLPQTEQCDVGLVEGLVGIEHMHALGRHNATGKLPVFFEESADVVAPWIIGLDHESAHARLLPKALHWVLTDLRAQGHGSLRPVRGASSSIAEPVAPSIRDFDRYIEEHGIPEEDYPAAFARWNRRADRRPGARFEKVEPGDEQILEDRAQRELGGLPSALDPAGED